MGEVWRRDCGPDLVLLLALADHADDDGGNVYPSLEFTAWKIGVSRSTVKRRIGDLRARGVLLVEREPTRHEPAHYRLAVDQLPAKAPFIKRYKGDQSEPPKSVGGLSRARQGAQNDAVRGLIAMDPEPSVEPSVEPSKGAQGVLDVDEPRVQALITWHHAQLRERQIPLSPVRATTRAAARELLRLAPGSDLREMFAFAISRTFWASRVATLPKWKQHYAALRIEWLAARSAQTRGRTGDEARWVPPATEREYDPPEGEAA